MSKLFGVLPLTEAAWNHFQNLIGWEDSRKVMGQVNVRGWAVLRGYLWKIFNDEKSLINQDHHSVKVSEFLYDQPFIFENEGVIVVLVDETNQKVYLDRIFRMIGSRILNGFDSYIKQVEEGDLWAKVFKAMG